MHVYHMYGNNSAFICIIHDVRTRKYHTNHVDNNGHVFLQFTVEKQEETNCYLFGVFSMKMLLQNEI